MQELLVNFSLNFQTMHPRLKRTGLDSVLIYPNVHFDFITE